jgi:hypothetical protein
VRLLGFAQRLPSARFFDVAQSSFAARFFAGNLPHGFETARLFGFAGSLASCVFDFADRGLAGGVGDRRIAAPFFRRSMVRTRWFADQPTRIIVIALLTRSILAIAARRRRILVAMLSIWTALVTDRLRFALCTIVALLFQPGRRAGRRSIVGRVPFSVRLDHAVQPFTDRRAGAPLRFARLRAEPCKIPRTARFHSRAQTTWEGQHAPRLAPAPA